MAALEISFDSMSDALRTFILEGATYSQSNQLGKDPLELIIELEQLAADYGYSDIHQFIKDYME